MKLPSEKAPSSLYLIRSGCSMKALFKVVTVMLSRERPGQTLDDVSQKTMLLSTAASFLGQQNQRDGQIQTHGQDGRCQGSSVCQNTWTEFILPCPALVHDGPR